MTVLPSILAAVARTPPAWVPDLGNDHYRNPILHADYSDPDAVRVGDDYWMVSSSFSHVPGLPILHSKDLVNWTLVTHALPRLVPEEVFRTPQHGKGVWAPSIRYHAGKYWIYYPDPDFGIYLLTASDPRGPWSAPVLVKAGQGLIDPCPLWDDDGRVYLIHGWAKSRAGIGNRLTLLLLSADGASVESDLGVIIDGDKVLVPGFRTLEGPKLYQRNGWYYVFAPAGGVPEGWQSVFRSRTIRGPYEHRIVLDQGGTSINGPHQGALVDTTTGEWWFLHFQDMEAYGRVVHLQPVVWRDDWPVIGDDPDGNGKGQPVLTFKKPNIGPALSSRHSATTADLSRHSETTADVAVPLTDADVPQLITVPPTSDEFDSPTLGLQWQWQANPGEGWFSLTARPGDLRLFAQPEPKPDNLYNASHLLLQKFPALEFTVTTNLEFAPKADGDSAGLMVFGFDYAWLGLKRVHGAPALVFATCHEAVKDQPQVESIALEKLTGPVWARVTVNPGAKCRFSYSLDGQNFIAIGKTEFTATPGRWVGAKVGLFANGAAGAHVDFAWFRVEPVVK